MNKRYYFSHGSHSFGSFEGNRNIYLSETSSTTNFQNGFDTNIYSWKEQGLTMWYSLYHLTEKNGYEYMPNSDYSNQEKVINMGDGITVHQDSKYDHALFERKFLWKGIEVSEQKYLENLVNLFKEWEEKCYINQASIQMLGLETFQKKGFFNSQVFGGWSSWGTNKFSVTSRIKGLTTMLDIKYSLENQLIFSEEHRFFSY